MVPASLNSLMTISLLLTFNIFNALVIVETTNTTLERLNSSTSETIKSVSANSTTIEQNKTTTSTTAPTTTTTTAEPTTTTASTTTTTTTTPTSPTTSTTTTITTTTTTTPTTTTSSTTTTTTTSSTATTTITTTQTSTQASMSFEYEIKSTWNNQPIDHEPIRIKLERNELNDLNITINAPFFNDPPKPDKKVGDFFNLWDYEGISRHSFLGLYSIQKLFSIIY
jgi:hypothetical protein